MGRVIGFISSKGGVGKTSIIEIVSKGLIGFGCKVCVFDSYFSSNVISLIIGNENDIDLKEYLIGNKGTQCVLNKSFYNLYYVKTNSHVFDYYKHLNLIKFFIEEISQIFDYVLIDINSFDRAIFESMVGVSSEIICVCSGDEIEIRNMAKMISSIKFFKKEIVINLILNKFKVISSMIGKCLGEKEIFELLKVGILATIQKFYKYNKTTNFKKNKNSNNLVKNLSYSIITNKKECYCDYKKYKGLFGMFRRWRYLKYE